MTRAAPDDAARSVAAISQSGAVSCPSCGDDFDTVVDGGCPSCGAVIASPSVISDDNTPFAQASRRDRAARRRMRRWLYFAGADRVRHLSLIRPSDASRRFARRHLLYIAIAVTLWTLSHVGVHRVVRTADNADLLSVEPVGLGWTRLAHNPDASPVTRGPLALWWNYVQAGVGGAVAFLTGLAVAHIGVGVLQFGTRRTVSSSRRRERRLQGAMHYLTAFAAPILLASLVIALVPVRHALDTVGVPFMPPEIVILAVAGGVTALAVAATWFWALSLAQALPMDVRMSATVYLAVVAPIVIGLLVVGWRVGLDALFGFLWPLFNLQW